jgi:hypothetical protein
MYKKGGRSDRTRHDKYVVTKYGKHTEIHALRQVAARTFSLIIFNLAGNVGHKLCHKELHHEAELRSTRFLLRFLHNKMFKSCQPLSVMILVAGVTLKAVKGV